jgi:HEAT repeat protein
MKAFASGDWAVRLLSAIGDPAVPVLLEGLKSGALAIRIRCAEALGAIGNAQGVAPLIQHLGANVPVLREVAAESLARIGAPAVLPLIRILADSDSPLHDAAGAVLVTIGAPAAGPLIETLKEADTALPEKAAGLLTRIGASAVSELVVRLADPEPVIQIRCAEVLVQIGGPAVSPLVSVVDGGHPGRLWRAAEILGKIKDPEAVETLMGVTDHGDPAVRYFAVEALGKIKDPRALPVLVDALPDRWAGRRAAAALSALGWRPDTPDQSLYYDFFLPGRKTLLNTAEVKSLLLFDLCRGNRCRKAFALFALTDLFKASMLPELVRILETEGSREMAALFVESDADLLVEAGLNWLADHAPEAYYEASGIWLFRKAP